MAIPHELLLHPELLSNEQLMLIIQERQLRVPNVENMPRYELLEVFHNFCVPYGQRRYKDTGRGKMLNKTRQLSPEPKFKVETLNNNQNRKTSYPWHSERLKPPPDTLSGQLKMIKLDSKMFSSNISNMDNCKRKINVETATPATDSPPPKKARVQITWP